VNRAPQESVPPGTRRQFSASEKLRIVNAADAALASGVRGAVEALLRKEGVYSSLLSAWRAQLGVNGAAGLAARKPGRKPKLDAKDRELLAVTKENEALQRKLRVANALIALQKKAHELLGLALPEPPEDET
jgi:transposase-like protein